MDFSNESDSDSEEELSVDNSVSGQSLRAKTAAKRKEIKETKKSLRPLLKERKRITDKLY